MSMSEPHINGEAMHELYMFILWYVGHPRCTTHTQYIVHGFQIFRAVQTA